MRRPVLFPAAGDRPEVRLAKVVGLALCAVLIVVDLAVLALYDDAHGAPVSPSSTSYASTTVPAVSVAPSSSSTSTIPPAPPTTAAPAPTPAASDIPAKSSSGNVTPEPRVIVTVSRCAEALADVQASGLELPAGVDWYCPGPAIDELGHYRTGLFSWSNVCQPGDHTPGIGCFIDIDEPGIRSDARLRNVIAHELCHAIQPVELRADPPAAEADAVACTGDHGFGYQR